MRKWVRLHFTGSPVQSKKDFQVFIHQCQGGHARSFLITGTNQKNAEKKVQITVVKHRTTLQKLLIHTKNFMYPFLQLSFLNLFTSYEPLPKTNKPDQTKKNKKPYLLLVILTLLASFFFHGIPLLIFVVGLQW